MTAPQIIDRENDRSPAFTTAEIKSRIEALFAARARAERAGRDGSRDLDEKAS